MEANTSVATSYDDNFPRQIGDMYFWNKFGLGRERLVNRAPKYTHCKLLLGMVCWVDEGKEVV